MARDQREVEPPEAAGAAPAARVRGVACLAGVSLERGVPAEEIQEYVRDADNTVWLDVQDPGRDEVAMLVDEFGFHPLTLEDAGEGHRRPKVNEYKGYLVLVTHAAVAGGDPRELRTAEVDLFLGRNYVVTVHRGRVPALDEALARWTRGGPLLREGVGFLVYSVLDAMIDSYVPLIDGIEEEIAETEITIFTRSDEEGLRDLLRLKRTLVSLRRVLYPLREVFQVLLRRDHPYVPAGAQVYLRDAYDHVLRLLDVLDTERDMAAVALDATLTVSANRLNRTMKTLAVITVAVAVVGSVFGAYGMNFEALPFSDSPWGFWVISVGTLAAVAAALAVARRRGWW